MSAEQKCFLSTLATVEKKKKVKVILQNLRKNNRSSDNDADNYVENSMAVINITRNWITKAKAVAHSAV